MEHSDLLKNELAYALSDKDLQKIHKGNFFIYNDLSNFDNIDDVFGEHNVCYILIETDRKNNGHYVCLIRRGNMIEFFDSYSKGIEKQKEYVRPELLDLNNHISNMLINSHYRVSYNHYRFQDDDPNIATCGRWCGLRSIYNHLPLSKFKDMVVNECVRMNVMPDDWAVMATEKYII